MKQLFIFIALFTACANAAQAQEVYGYEEKVNLTSRQGVHGTEQENFTYDNLDRLTEVNTTSGAGDMETEYEANGNIGYKTGIGSYLYDTQKRHAVAQGGNTLTFFYGPDNQRWQTTLMADGAIGKTLRFLGDYEVVDRGGVQREYWYVADGVVLYRESPSGGMNTGMVLLNGGSFKDAMNSGWQGLWQGAAIGTITGTGRGIVDGQQNLSISKLSPQQKGQVGVERAINEFVAHGGYNIQREVTIEVEGVRIRLDFVGYDELGNLQLFEIKYGPYARPTPNQKIVIRKLQQGVSFIPYGKNATQIHLSIGVPYMGKYKFNYIHY